MIEYLILITLLIIMYGISLWDRGREGFESGKTLNVSDFYDTFYAEIYNPLWHSSKIFNEFEQVTIQESLLAEKQKSSLKILDLSYDIIGKLRFRIFGRNKNSICNIIDVEIRKRILF
jgi:hypothetical protein